MRNARGLGGSSPRDGADADAFDAADETHGATLVRATALLVPPRGPVVARHTMTSGPPWWLAEDDLGVWVDGASWCDGMSRPMRPGGGSSRFCPPNRPGAAGGPITARY
ncbi:hypothetical protein Acsp04_55530 [Actinomadura sp. NBRC 104425]|nr:hypothetical protein Acsp04_55530 [Actinomadura sp. NBRC 104425]